jgi:pimeloyl-ACP methyl ester carboxylesterase
MLDSGTALLDRPGADAAASGEAAEGLYVSTLGSGPQTVVGLHGWAGSHASFSPLMSRLPAGATLHCPDLPGYGRSAAPHRWSLGSITDPIDRWMDHTRATGITLVASCIGGAVAMELARRRPQSIARVVLIDPFTYAPIYFRLFTWGLFGRVAYYSTFANPLGRLLTNASLAGKRGDDSHLTCGFQSVRHDTALHYLTVGCAIDAKALCAAVRIPVDIVYGRRSFAAVKQSVAELREYLVDCRAVELEAAGHLPIQEATEAVAAITFAGRIPA